MMRETAAHTADLRWIDDFWRQCGAHIFSREEDGILILPPNRVYKINPQAASLVRYLKNGGKAEDIKFPEGDGNSAERERRRRETDLFFRTVAGLYCNDPGAEAHLARVPFDFDFTRLPILGEIAVTYRCNNRCRFCYAGCGAVPGPCGEKKQAPGSANRTGMRDMDTGSIKKIIDIFKNEAKIPFFSFTGGEPLLRDDLEELTAYAVSRGLDINLISNGTLAGKKRAAALNRAGLRTAQISIEGTDEQTHDDLAGRPGAMKETLAGIRALQDAGISVQTNTTVSRKNIGQVHMLPQFLKTLGIDRFSMNMFIPSGTGLLSEELSVGYDEIGSVVDRVRKEAFAAGMTFYWYSPTPFCYYNPIARGLGNKSCAAVDGLVSVAPNGDILPCSSWDEPVGNLFKKKFTDIWFSDRALFFKRKQFAPAKCASCSSFTACQGACPLYWKACGESLLKEVRT